MIKFDSGDQVPYGLYAAPLMDVRFVGADWEILDGKPGKKYVRLPISLMIAASPILGGVFVLAFPLIVVAMVVYSGFSFAVGKIAKTLPQFSVNNWEPAVSYLVKRKNNK